MIIKSLSIQNIKSIGNKINLHFEDGINILIGPNGGGKSNIMDILNIVLNTYFIFHCQLQTTLQLSSVSLQRFTETGLRNEYYTVAFSSKRGSLMPHLSLSSMSPQ